MKLYRITREGEYEKVLSNRRILNQGICRGWSNKDNTIPNRYKKVFYFFVSLKDAIDNYGAIADSEHEWMLCEYDVPDDMIVARGQGYYSAWWLGLYTVSEVVTKEIQGSWLSNVFEVHKGSEYVEDEEGLGGRVTVYYLD